MKYQCFALYAVEVRYTDHKGVCQNSLFWESKSHDSNLTKQAIIHLKYFLVFRWRQSAFFKWVPLCSCHQKMARLARSGTYFPKQQSLYLRGSMIGYKSILHEISYSAQWRRLGKIILIHYQMDKKLHFCFKIKGPVQTTHLNTYWETAVLYSFSTVFLLETRPCTNSWQEFKLFAVWMYSPSCWETFTYILHMIYATEYSVIRQCDRMLLKPVVKQRVLIATILFLSC